MALTKLLFSGPFHLLSDAPLLNNDDQAHPLTLEILFPSMLTEHLLKT